MKKKIKKSVKNCCLAAAKLLESKGWIKGRMACYQDEDEDGFKDWVDCSPTSTMATNYCMVGALDAVGTPSNILYDISDINSEITRYKYDSLEDWNDSDSRRKSDVINRLKKIAIKSKETK